MTSSDTEYRVYATDPAHAPAGPVASQERKNGRRKRTARKARRRRRTPDEAPPPDEGIEREAEASPDEQDDPRVDYYA